MGDVKIRRVSTNLQNKFFHTSQLPATFEAEHYEEAERLRSPGKKTWTFKDRNGVVADLVIPTPGILNLDSSLANDRHNIASAKAYAKGVNTIGIAVDDFDEIATLKAVDRTRRTEALLMLNEFKNLPGFFVSLARRLGMADAEKSASAVVLDFIQERCETEPSVVVSMLTTQHLDELFEIDKALVNGFITRNGEDGLYRYGELVIGSTEGALLDFFRSKHPDIYDDIRSRNAAVSASRVQVEQAEQVRLGVAPIVPSIAEMTRQVTTNVERDRVKALLNQAIEAMLVQDKDGVFVFGQVPLTMPTGNGDRVSRAVDFLSVEKNKGLLGQITKAIATAQALQD